ncbi:Chondroitin polymerase [Pluralibacter gergoviae]|uniref:glycosyltransferase n=1 Tax=Pluralibacter gergoviae TaxID=61647 RepID=UPI000907F233|nr:glycosyltransferase [Pluralibacter gergoviae]SUB70554.1 Chondroitin polymerase [Pluralibacter gergoviae]
MSDLVSVYITTCNRLEKLKRALKSVVNQTYENIEVIVSDDASDDGTKLFMDNYVLENKKCKYIRNNQREGACATRNKAINIACGKFITGLDDDDEFLPNRIEVFIRHWDDEYSFLCANFFEVYNDKQKKKYYTTHDNTLLKYTDLLYENNASNQVFTLTERLKCIDGFNTKVSRLQDWDTWLRLSYKYGDFLRLDTVTYLMHHDHALDEYRVSGSYPLGIALDELLERNKEIYASVYYKRKLYLNYFNNNLSFLDSIKWAFIDKNPLHMLRFFYQFNRKNTQ